MECGFNYNIRSFTAEFDRSELNAFYLHDNDIWDNVTHDFTLAFEMPVREDSAYV